MSPLELWISLIDAVGLPSLDQTCPDAPLSPHYPHKRLNQKTSDQKNKKLTGPSRGSNTGPRAGVLRSCCPKRESYH